MSPAPHIRTPVLPDPSRAHLLQILEKGSPYPLIILPQFGGYWIEDPENLGTPTSSDSSICEDEEENLSPSTYGYKLECKGEARAYRKHFLGKVGALAQMASGWLKITPKNKREV